MQAMQPDRNAEDLDLDLDRDVFFRSLIRELAGTLQEVVGTDEASGFVSVVGQRIGTAIDGAYREAWRTDRLSPEQIGQVLVDLKRRIGGDFFILELNEDRIVLGNRACPFGEKVHDRPALCMMTSNVFGSIAADNVGYAKVVLDETIAQGAPGCRVTVWLRPTEDADRARGREYFGPEPV